MEPSPSGAGTSTEDVLDPTNPVFIQNPYSFYARVREHSPVAPVHGGQWVVTGHREVTEVLTDADRFTSARNLEGDYPFTPEADSILRQSEYYGHGMFNADPPDHERLRSLLADFFSPRSARALEPLIEQMAHLLIDTLGPRKSADLITQFAQPLALAVICSVMGIPEEDYETVRRWSQDWTALLVLPLPPQEQIAHARRMVEFDEYMRRLLIRRSTEPSTDAASVLAQAAFGPDRRCTIAEAVVLLRSLVLAGHETTAGLIGNAVYHLLRTGAWQRLVADPRLIAAATEEALRYDPSSQSTTRVARQDVPIAGVTIPAGARVHVMTGACGRDPRRTGDESEFRVDRGRSVRHVAFGYGIHYCLGAALTRSETNVALAVLAKRLPGLRLSAEATGEFLPGGFSFRSLAGLPVDWD